MSASSTFELLGFTTVAAGAGAALIEVEGAFPGGRAPHAGATRLLAEGGDGSRHELPALVAGGGAERWRASFAVPLTALPGASYALVVGRVVVELPPPDALAADADRLVRSAREVNALRRELERTEVSAAEGEALRSQADALRAERDALRDDLASAAEDAEREHSEVAERLAAVDAARESAEQALAAAAAEAEERVAVAQEASEERARVLQLETEALAEQLEAARKELAHEREGAEMTVRALREALDASHDETHEVRRHLKHVRAELEALRRDQTRPRSHRPSADGRDGIEGGPIPAPDDDWEGAAEGVRVLGPVRRTPAEPNGEAATATEIQDADTEEVYEELGSEDPTSLLDGRGEDDETEIVDRPADNGHDPDQPSTRSMFAEPRGTRTIPVRQAPLPPITATYEPGGAGNASSRWLVVALLVVGFAALLAILFGLLGA